MSDSKQQTRPGAAYEADFYGWTQEQARLRTQRPAENFWPEGA